MTDQHPIPFPPVELVRKWLKERPVSELAHSYLAAQAAQWGADQELEACCEWLQEMQLAGSGDIEVLRNHRRPKSLTLKEQALNLLQLKEPRFFNRNMQDIIRRALEQLPND